MNGWINKKKIKKNKELKEKKKKKGNINTK